MFGIDQISWGQFIQAILLVLLLWYLSLILFSRFNRKGKNHKTLFEDDFAGSAGMEALQPALVSSGDFPSEMIPMIPFGSVPLPVSFYEEIGINDGYSLDRFRDSKDPLPASVMKQIHFQQ
ncbi:MAG: hypothetical protein RBS73_11280 [Prolixibacteraceae bacterium]|jgi:hypothetical protein|nr:hypothetical protein [Prolixibacteraceae bacterium]